MTTINLPIDDIRTDGGTQTRAEINLFVVKDYSELMQAGVKFPPVDAMFDGENYWLVDGFHRYNAACDAEIDSIAANVTDGTRRDAQLAAARANEMHGLRRTNADKRRAVLMFLNDDEWKSWSDNAIAEACRVSQPFVSSVRSKLITDISSPPQKRIGRDGKKRKVKRKSRAKPKAAKPASKATSTTSTAAHATTTEQTDEAPVDTVLVNDAAAVELVNKAAPMPVNETAVEGEVDDDTDTDELIVETQPKRSDEWYTPRKYVDAARKAMGGIDLDPASNDVAQRTVKAGTYYTADDDGLTKDWAGNVFLNPPFRTDLIKQFVAKLVASVKSGDVEQAVLLTHNSTDTTWWHEAAAASSAICFTRGRISFCTADGEPGSPTSGHTFFYFGERVESFVEAFERFGFITRNSNHDTGPFCIGEEIVAVKTRVRRWPDEHAERTVEGLRGLADEIEQRSTEAVA